MAKSNKPIVWAPFAAGGTVTAFITPVMIVMTLMVGVDAMPDIFQYENMLAFATHWLGKLSLFVVIALTLWHGAHRFRITLHDFGLRMDIQVAVVLYGISSIGTVGTLLWLLPI